MLLKAAYFILTTTVCLISLQSAANPSLRYDSPNTWASGDICQMRAEDFLEKAAHPSNLTPNPNDPGPLKTGLCWWHSKMQRAAIYLAVFDRPLDRKPTKAEAIEIFKTLKDLKSVVSIPGFNNWFDFSDEYSSEFYKVLGQWEIIESLQLGFLKGVRVTKETDLQMLQKIHDEVNDYKRVAFVLLKLPYVAAHSWLVQSMEMQGSHFTMGYIDSITPKYVDTYQSKGNTYTYQLHHGAVKTENPLTGKTTYKYNWEPSVEVESYADLKGLIYANLSGPVKMSLYLQNDNLPFQKIVSAIKKKCGGDTPFTLHEKEVVKRKIQKEFERQNWYRPGVPHN